MKGPQEKDALRSVRDTPAQIGSPHIPAQCHETAARSSESRVLGTVLKLNSYVISGPYFSSLLHFDSKLVLTLFSLFGGGERDGKRTTWNQQIWPRSESPARIIPPRHDLSLLPATSPPCLGSRHEFIPPLPTTSEQDSGRYCVRLGQRLRRSSGAKTVLADLARFAKLSEPQSPETHRHRLPYRGRYRVHNCYFSGPHGQRRKRKFTLRADSTVRQETRGQKKETGQRTTRGKARRRLLIG